MTIDTQINLPALVPHRTIDGVPFDAAAPIWHFRTAAGPLNLDFTNLPGTSDGLRACMQAAFAAILLSTAPERARSDLTRVRRFVAWLYERNGGQPVPVLTAADILAFGETLPRTRRYVLRQLKDALLAWTRTGVDGLSEDLRQLLPKLRTESHMVGVAVRTMDPETGPLTDLEYEALLAALRIGFTEGRIALDRYVLVTLAIAFGLRPLQLALLKVGDYTPARKESKPTLRIARIKQGKGVRPGAYVRIRELAVEMARLVEAQCDEARRWAAANDVEAAKAPLFPAKEASISPYGLRGHLSGRYMSDRLSRTLANLNVRSERAEGRMHLFQTRLRRTLGTRAAAEGKSLAVIADLMDHTWETCSLVYIETRPAMMERIDKAIALKMAPLAQAFAGTLAVEGESRGRPIHLPTAATLEPLGGCGKADFCGLAAPVACYTCTCFHPWLDAPHEELLDNLLREREILVVTCDLRIAAINDRTILAVADVVNRCRAASGEGGDR